MHTDIKTKNVTSRQKNCLSPNYYIRDPNQYYVFIRIKCMKWTGNIWRSNNILKNVIIEKYNEKYLKDDLKRSK